MTVGLLLLLLAQAESGEADKRVIEPPAPVVVEAQPAQTPVEAEPIAPHFIKGELSTYLGSDRLTVKNNRIGVSAGLDRFGQAYYLLVEPQVDLRFFDHQLGVGLGVPLRFEIVNFVNGTNGQPILFEQLGRFRHEDWRSFHDAGKVLKYINYGHKEDTLYINVGQRYASSVGHGTLVRRYAPNIDIDYVRVSAEVDAYNDWGGFELVTNDILEWNQLAGIGFVKPLAFLHSENTLVKSFSVGVSGALDWKAPLALQTDASRSERVLDDFGRLKATTQAVKLVGIDAEIKVIKTDHVDLKPYVDYSILLGGDGGLTLGALGRFNFGKSIVNAFRVVAELRVLGARYQPSYFDTFYEVERFIYKESGRSDQGLINYLTKQEVVLSGSLGQRSGYYFEGSWGIRDAVAVTVALEGVSNSAEKNFVAHVEVPVLSFFQIFGSYYKRAFVGFDELGKLDEKSIFFAGARLKILPFLFVNGRAYKTFRINPDLQRYDNQLGFVVDLEVGYEFGEKKAPES